MDGDPIITITDARRAGLCATGLRLWFARNGFDFRDFVKNGARESVLRQSGDHAMIDRVVQLKSEAEHGRK